MKQSIPYIENKTYCAFDISIEKKQIDIINVIAEMTPHLLEHKKIGNKESSEMYNWALYEKKNNALQCDTKQEEFLND